MDQERQSGEISLARRALQAAGVNAGSYFWLSEGWGDLLGRNPEHAEAIGFPFVFWQEEGLSVEIGINRWALLGDLAIALAAALPLGLLIRALPETPEGKPLDRPAPFQYSLRGLLLLTTAAAVVAGLSRAFDGAGSMLLVTCPHFLYQGL